MLARRSAVSAMGFRLKDPILDFVALSIIELRPLRPFLDLAICVLFRPGTWQGGGRLRAVSGETRCWLLAPTEELPTSPPIR